MRKTLRYILFFGYVAPLLITVMGAKAAHTFSKSECHALITAFIFMVISIAMYWQRKPRKKLAIANGTVTMVRYLTDIKEIGNDDVNCELSICFPSGTRNTPYNTGWPIL